jgi:D-alanyl-D-alanine carboxypeptidase
MAFFRRLTAKKLVLTVAALAVIGLSFGGLSTEAFATTAKQTTTKHKSTAHKSTAHKSTSHKAPAKKTASKKSAKHHKTASAPANDAVGNPKYASLVMDADTGQIISQANPDKLLYPASLTKMMTLLLTFEAIEDGTLRLRDRIPVSQHAASMQPSRLDLPAGSTIRTEDAIYAVVTKSANDIAVALAERVGGNEARFVNMMNNRARSIGMTHTAFANACGLHSPAQVTTARDMAILARYIIKRYPNYYQYFSTRNFSYLGVTYRNHNHLMERYKGMDGFKTGFINPSGFNLVASAVRGHHRLIGVVFGGRSAVSRDNHMAKLMDEAFATYESPAIAQNGRQPVLASIAPLPAPSFTKEAPADGNDAQWAQLRPMLQNKPFSESLDPSQAAAVDGIRKENTAAAAQRGNAQPMPSPTVNRGWSIQIGAYASPTQTDAAVKQALNLLPRAYANGSAQIVPLRTNNGTVYRGRISGYTREEALQACRYIKSCLPVSPQAY